ncbi:hypothetical protein LTS18_004984, partial [Coniosporium uncinatum]
MSSNYKIAIVGAGPAGCTLARLLHLAGISTTIFEGETTLQVRAQGGTLDLHTDTGIAALKECGIYEQFLEWARFDGESFVVCDKNLKKYINMAGTKDDKSTRGRPEIDRVRLRKILLDSLPEGCVRWGCRLRTVEQDAKTGDI